MLLTASKIFPFFLWWALKSFFKGDPHGGRMDNEQRQIEHFRELDMEELQVEEVDSDQQDSSNDDPRQGDGGIGPLGGITFDTSLTSLHTYLGEVDDTHHRLAFFDGGAILILPMFYLEGGVLFPEATLPLRVIESGFKAAVERALQQVDAPCTIGVVRVQRKLGDYRFCYASIGTTAEIRQYRRLEDGSFNVVTRGQQRFRLRRRWIDVDGVPCAEVQIIQEDIPMATPKDAVGQLASITNFQNGGSPHLELVANSRTKHDGYESEENDWDCLSEPSIGSDRSRKAVSIYNCDDYESIGESTSSDDEFVNRESHRLGRFHKSRKFQRHYHFEEKVSERDGIELRSPEVSIERRDSVNAEGRRIERRGWAACGSKWLQRAHRSYWPHWVYRMYDSYILARTAAAMWRQITGHPCMNDLIRKPDLLSFYIASKIPVSESTRQELLEINGVSYRLRKEIKLLECFDLVRCKNCETVIARRSDMVVMSSDGPLNAFVNPQGYVHEVMTLNTATGLALRGHPVKEHSWFPGYAWTIVNCAGCESNMGWFFTATNKKLQPRSFWGIRSSQVSDKMH